MLTNREANSSRVFPRGGWGLLICLALFCGTSLLSAQDAAPTRIAILNIGEVLAQYQKATNAKKELEAVVQPYKALSDKLRSELTKLQQEATDPKADDDAKNAARQKVLAMGRKLEDLETEARSTIGKKSEQSFIDIYSDIQAAVQKEADAKNFDLVLIYGEQLNKDDVLKFANLTRKLQAANQGAVVPIFIRPRIDLTQATLKSLNEAYAAKNQRE
jgi:Skp family chaperone for outer membrane proteins